MSRTRTRTTLGLALAAAGLAAALPMAGCRGDRSEKPPHQFFPDLDDGPSFKPQSRTPFFADGRTMRAPEAGTVAFGVFSFTDDTIPGEADWTTPFMREREDMLGEGIETYSGLNADGTPVQTMPISVTAELLARGEERFNIYCSACHGYSGDGNGMVGRRWSIPVPSFHDAKYKDQAEPTSGDGYLFHVARNGLKHPDGRYRMPGYGHALTVEDTWAVVAHVRVLQQAFDNDPQSLPAEARDQLDPRGRPTGTTGSTEQGGGQ